MTRDEALREVRENVPEANLVKHMLAAEAVMRSLAGRMGQDPGLWGLAGLLHDLDYARTAKDPARHGRVTVEMLAGRGLPPELLDAVLSHAGHRERLSDLDRALWAADPVTGLVTAAALIRPDRKLAPVEPENLLRRFKEKGFARGADREQIRGCEALGIPLEEFLALSLAAMKGIAGELGL